MIRIFCILSILIVLMYNNCWAEDEFTVTYTINNKKITSSLEEAKANANKYTEANGTYLEYPYAIEDGTSWSNIYFLYSLEDIENMGYSLCCYGIDSLDYSDFIKNPTEDFLENNSMYYLKFNKYNDSFIDYSKFDKSLISYNISRNHNIMLEEEPWRYYIDKATVELLRNENVTELLKEQGIYANVIKAQLVYSVEDWRYNLNNEPIIWIETESGDYFISDLFEYTFTEQGRDPKELIANEYSNIKIYSQSEAIYNLCNKKGTVFINGNDISNIVNAVFSYNTVTVPLREFAESIGYSVEWDSTTGTTRLKSDKYEILFKSNVWSFGYDGTYKDRFGKIRSIENTNEVYTNSVYMKNGKIYITNDVIYNLSELIGGKIIIDNNFVMYVDLE